MKKAIILDFFGVLVENDIANTDLIALMREMKEKGSLLFVMSNADEDLWAQQIAKHDFLSQGFDKLYYSGQTGLMKPDPRAYQLILQENDLQPEDCIYFDDGKTNIEVVQSLGIESYLFAGAEDARSRL
ncbi:MAG TPA: HAD-IA family hydrolase [Candidatus Paceibacterota bacterium]